MTVYEDKTDNLDIDDYSQPIRPRKNRRKRKNRFWLKTFLLLIVLLLLGTGAGAAIIYGQYQTDLQPLSSVPAEEVIVQIPSNSTVREIGALLEKQGIIKSGRSFEWYNRLQSDSSALKAGEYLLSPDKSVPQIRDILVQGKTFLHTVTIPEGYTVKQVAKLLQQKGLADEQKFMQAIIDYPEEDFLKGIPRDMNRLEGYLFPATYKISSQQTEADIVKMIVNRFKQELKPEVLNRLAEMDLTLRQAVIMASLVEREVVKAEERHVVSAVFFNRLKRQMRLEACSTVQYLLETPKPKLYYKDLEIDSPYNTYRNSGLPPGPICSPGLQSLQAVLYPANVDYLYFVAKDDGSHHFSRTLKEHDQAVAKYVN